MAPRPPAPGDQEVPPPVDDDLPEDVDLEENRMHTDNSADHFLHENRNSPAQDDDDIELQRLD